ncbi:MAG: HEAT repeat domain-containing protein [Bryobacterales bacterium]|nr:HEAT repeat domain-containing protein [Bryobacterales bacterium]
MLATAAIAAAVVAMIVASAACGSKSPVDGLDRTRPLVPEEALRTFRLSGGFRIEVAASEPNVTDPIAAAFDENGRLYVAEMRGYPYDPPPGGQAAGRIRLLEDTDWDGVYETSRLFADRLHWPSGIACWNGGIFVTAAPDIVYLKDTTGDGIADARRTVFTGFGTDKSEDIVNNLKWGLDHWIYGTTSYNGATVVHAERPTDPGLALGANDFRFNPKTERIEAVEGTRGDFGNAFDDWGNRFGSNSGNPVIHAVYPLSHVVEGWEPTRLAAPAFVSDRRVFPISRPEPWRVARRQHWARWVDTTPDMRARRFPPQELAEQGYFTGGAGLGIYRGDAYPAGYRGNAFAPEPAGNLVLRTVLERDGVTFRASRAEDGREFLASADNWFRPVNLVNGPDGCLYLLDMYREVIEDPSAIPDEILAHIDYYSGQDLGRIYRIVPVGFRRGARPSLGAAPLAELVDALEHPDGWWRDTAHRLLFELRPAGASAALRSLVRRSDSPQARLHALWSLEGLGQLDEPSLLAALADPHPDIRRNAVRLAELRSAPSMPLRERVASMSSDRDAAVRFRAALAIPGLAPGLASEILAGMLPRDAGDEWIRAAAFAGAHDDPLGLLERLVRDKTFLAGPGSEAAVRQMASSVASKGRPDAIQSVLAAMRGLDDPQDRGLQISAAAGIATGLESRGESLANLVRGPESPQLAAELAAVLDVALTVAVEPAGATPTERTEAIRLLRWAPAERALPALANLLTPDEPAAVQLAAVRSLGFHRGEEVGRILAAAWRTYSPAVRREAAEALFSRDERLPAFLDALENGTALASHLDPIRQTALLGHAQAEIRERARGILAGQTAAPLADALGRHRAALALTGDARAGAPIFERECATCHRLAGVGHDVGPDLVERASSPRAELLVDILDPNRSLQSNYVNYRLDTRDGRVVTGVLAREWAKSLTLRRGEGIEDTVQRREIADLTSMGLSLMPEGLGDEISPAEMADLLAFLRGQARQ